MTVCKRKGDAENVDFLNKKIQEIKDLKLDQTELESIETRRHELKKISKSNAIVSDALKSLNRNLVEENI